MATARELFTATLLNKGEVLAAGGQNSNLAFPFLSSGELYNPTIGKWGATGSLNPGRYNHTATLLSNGQALAVGGYEGNGGNIGYLSSAELFQ